MSQKRKPIQISSIKELQRIGRDPNYPLDGYYELVQDIDASETINWYNGTGFRSIGTLSYPFKGKFDGKGHKIIGLYIKNNYDENKLSASGLFVTIDSVAEIKNVVIENATLSDEFGYIGTLVGDNEGTIRNCYSINCSISGCYNAGSLVGSNYGTVACCYSTGTVSGSVNVGGLAGDNYGTLSNCYNTCWVSGRLDVGGLSGRNFGTIINSYNTGSVSGGRYVGGLVGENLNIISNCYNTGSVSGRKIVGSLVGENYDIISNCYNQESVYGEKNTGELVGELTSGEIINSYNIGSIFYSWVHR